MRPRNELASYDGRASGERRLKRQGRTLADAIQELINDMVP